MGLVITVICVLALAAATVYFSPARRFVLDAFSGLNRFKFSCKATIHRDESREVNDRDSLCIQMQGRIPTPTDHYDTNVRVELEDVTGGLFKQELILSVDPDYRRGDDTTFLFETHNGQVPQKNAVLPHWVTVATIPCSALRFAYRGRRKLLCRLSVLSAETGDVLVTGQQIIEYVSCSEGYRQIQQRKLDLLTSSIQLAVMTSSHRALTHPSQTVFTEWLDEAGQHFSAVIQLKESLNDIFEKTGSMTMEQAGESLLAYGDPADRTAAFELALKILVTTQCISSANGQALIELAHLLDLKSEQFLILCQQYFLQEDCQIEDPSFMLGVDTAMDESAFRARLNEEYRKWNARVTHPNKSIRRQADRMLTVIAELRSAHQVCSQ
ncbi:MAG: hypothetical protein ACYSUT_00125 [Planctomycetota bacterium]|jgi:hypothetical protein